MKCSLPPHPTLSFPTFSDFETHYAQAHTNRCSSCHKNFPTEHFLSLHISENHDPLEEARRAKGEKTYRCFVDGCDKVCSAPLKRRMHLTDKHMFPKNYDFLIVNDGIDKRSSMLRTRHRRASSAAERAVRRDKQVGVKGGQNLENSVPVDEGEEVTEVQGAELVPMPTANGVSTSEVDMDVITSGMSALKFVPSSVRFGRGGRRGGFSRS